MPSGEKTGLMTKVKYGLLALVSVAAAGGLIWKLTFGPISDGYRDGYVYKVSQRGRVWKTLEGELAIPGYTRAEAKPGQVGGSVWAFSVDNPEIAKELEKVNGEMLVRLHYVEYSWTLPWQGDTHYRITKFERLNATTPKE